MTKLADYSDEELSRIMFREIVAQLKGFGLPREMMRDLYDEYRLRRRGRRDE